MSWLRADVGADIEKNARPSQRRHDRGDSRSFHVLEKAAEAQAAGYHGASIARAYNGLYFSLREKLPAAADRIIRLLSQRHDGRLFHRHHLRAVEDVDSFRRSSEKRLDLRPVANQGHMKRRIGFD